MQMQSSQLPSQGQPPQQQQAQRGYYMAAAAGANLRPTQQGVAGTASYAAGLQGRRTNRKSSLTSTNYRLSNRYLATFAIKQLCLMLVISQR